MTGPDPQAPVSTIEGDTVRAVAVCVLALLVMAVPASAHRPRRTAAANVALDAAETRVQTCTGGMGQGPNLGPPEFIGGSKAKHYRRVRVRVYDPNLRVFVYVVTVSHDENGYPYPARVRLTGWSGEFDAQVVACG